MNRDQAKRLAPLLDPLAPAEPELHVQKPKPALDALREAWVFGADKGSHCLLVGARGTGKSTELRHLATAIALETDAPVVTLLRLQQQLDTGQISAAQVLFLLGVASLTLVGEDPPAAITRDLERAYAGVIQGDTGDFSVRTLLSRLSLLVGGAAKATGNPLVGALISGSGGLVKAAPRHLALPGRGRRLRANEPAITQLAEAVNQAMAWTRGEFARAPLAFFVDGLDKLDPSSIDELFGTGVLSLPDCPVVYAAPLALRYTLKGAPLASSYGFRFLTVHNFSVFAKRDPSRRNPEGFALMRKLVGLRLEAAQLDPKLVFADGLAEGGIVDDAIAMSGGVTQTLLSLLERSLRRAAVRAGDEDFVIERPVLDSVIDEARKALALRVSRSQYALLREIQADFSRPEGSGADELLYHNVVLSYPDNPAWFWPSPLLAPYLERPEP